MAGDRKQLQLTLDVDPTDDPIAGVVRDDQGERRDFAGWMELISAIEDARERRRHTSPVPTHDSLQGCS